MKKKPQDGTSHNREFVAHFVRPNPPSADFTNTEDVIGNAALKKGIND